MEIASSSNLFDSLKTTDGKNIITEIRLSDGYINLTKLCKSGGKELSNYLKNEQSKEFI